MEENLLKIEKFYKANLKIKELIYNLQPNEKNGYDKDSISMYAIKFLNVLDTIKFHLFDILDTFQYGEELKKIIEADFEEYGTKISSWRIEGFNDLEEVYKDCCSNMGNELISKVKKEFVGHYIFRGNIYDVINECHTINEVLHAIHSSIINNEYYYESMPKINEKTNNGKYPVVLCGRENELAKKLYDNFPLEMSCGSTDILALENNILIMVRDKGHALSIQIEIDANDTVWVRYFIPKICNVEMVNKLNGVDKVNKDSPNTIGVFRTTKENLSAEVIELIKGVPNDKDMKTESASVDNQSQDIQQNEPVVENLINNDQSAALLPEKKRLEKLREYLIDLKQKFGGRKK